MKTKNYIVVKLFAADVSTERIFDSSISIRNLKKTIKKEIPDGFKIQIIARTDDILEEF